MIKLPPFAWVLAATTAVACGSVGDAPSTTASTPAATARVASGRAPLPAARTLAREAQRKKRRASHQAPAPAADSATVVPWGYAAFASQFDLDAQSSGTPGAAVALIEHGRVTFTHGYGTRGPTSTDPVDDQTIFRVGALTQPLTAAAELSLMDKGKGSLGEAVATAVPGVALSGPAATTLTMREILSQESGLSDFTQLSVDPTLATSTCSTDPSTLTSFVTGSVFGQNAIFATPPGAMYTASNPNFILAGAAIEAQTGAYFTQAMASTLFAPLGMKRTFFLPSDVTAAGDYSDGTTYDANGNLVGVGVADYDCAAYRPFGYAFSSVTDYARFVQMLLGRFPGVLTDRSRVAMESAQTPTRDLGEVAAEGFGLTVSQGYVAQSNAYYPSKTLSSVSAEVALGYSSLFYAFPETGFGVVVLSNFSADFYDSIDLAVKSFAGLPPASPLPASTFSEPSRFADYAGTYADPSGYLGTTVVSDDGGAMTVSFAEAGDFGFAFWPQLSPVLDDSFLVIIDGYPNTLQFYRDANGATAYLLIDDLVPMMRVQADGG
jgi:CubicO group peptidase (beta-lactamase class C family)